MKRLFLMVFVLMVLFVMVACGKEQPTTTPVEIDLDVQEIKDVLNVHEYELLIIHDRREVSGGYEYAVKKPDQTYYNADDCLWLFSADYIKTGSQGLFIRIDEANYILKPTTSR